MPKINLLTLQPGDSQATLIDKINYNYDQLLNAGGGPQGIPGRQGETGPIGPQGSQGVTGPQGLGGTKWFVNSSGPTAGNPQGIPVNGDLWLRDSDKEIFILGPSGGGLSWLDSGYSLRTDQVFNTTGTNWVGGVYNATASYFTQKAQVTSLVLSDWNVGLSSPNYTGPSGGGINDEKSKFKIATDFGSEFVNLVSFGHASLDSSATGPLFSNTHNPVVKWGNNSPGSTAGTPGVWDLLFYNPIGNWNFISSAGNFSASSYNQNKLETTGASGGTLVNIPVGGYFQVNALGSTGYSSTPYFSVSATGPTGYAVGVNTVATANSFSVKGSATVAQNDSYNSYGFGTGYLGVENGLRVGATGFNAYAIPGSGSVGFSGYYALTGPKAHAYGTGPTINTPKTLLSGQGNGSVFQARLDNPGGSSVPNAGGTGYVFGLTGNSWMSWGDGSVYPFETISQNNLTQEYAVTGGNIPTGLPFAGYYHAAGNATGANSYSGATAGNPDPVTQFRVLSSYGVGTDITTVNQGKVLGLYANQYGATASNSRVVIGANGYKGIKVFSNSVRINSGNDANSDLPTDVNTGFTFEDKVFAQGAGAYFGYGASGLAYTLPSALTYWPSGCLSNPAPMGPVSRIKSVGSDGDDGMNGINLALESDGTPTGLGFAHALCTTGSQSQSKALVVTDYTFNSTHQPLTSTMYDTANVYATIGWHGHLTLGGGTPLSQLNKTVPPLSRGTTSVITSASIPAGLTAYGPDVASLFVFGDISMTGNGRSAGGSGWITVSSRSLKENIVTLDKGLEDILKMKPVKFSWIESQKEDIGFIAEDVFEIIPEAASINKEGVVEGYDANKIIPVLVKSIQDLASMVNDLKKEIEILKSK